MNWEKFTVMSREALQESQRKAEEMGHPELKPEHLLWAFLSQDQNIVNALLGKIGVDPHVIRSDIEKRLETIPHVEGGGEIHLSSDLRKLLTSAQNEAAKLKDEYVSTEHLFLAALKDSQGDVSGILRKHGVTEDLVFKALQEI